MRQLLDVKLVVFEEVPEIEGARELSPVDDTDGDCVPHSVDVCEVVSKEDTVGPALTLGERLPLIEEHIVGEVVGEAVDEKVVHPDLLRLDVAEGQGGTEPLGERVPLAQLLALVLAVVLAEPQEVVLRFMVGEELLQAAAVAEAQGEDESVVLGDELALEQGKEVREAEGDTEPLALVLCVGLVLAQVVGLSEGDRVALALAVVLAHAVVEWEGETEAVPQTEGLGLREGKPLDELLPDALRLPEALTEAQMVGETESKAVVVTVVQRLLLGKAEALGLGEAEALEDTVSLWDREPLAQPLALVLAVVLKEP